MHKRHIPVLTNEVLEVLRPKAGEIYIDCTAGFGGHAELIWSQVAPKGQMILIDQDPMAMAALEQKFGNNDQISLILSNFREVNWDGLPKADLILMDLGVSSAQIDQAQRGFSFQKDGPLDMRMDSTAELNASRLVNQLPEADLADIIWRFGEERHSRRIARAIVLARDNPIETTGRLRDIIHTSVGSGGKIDSATKTFQALRIAVNDELRALSDTLPIVARHLRPGGRLAVISFHSLEDRIVKNYFRQLTTSPSDPITGQPTIDVSYRQVTKKPIVASPHELVTNPRARSAKLRAVENQN